MRRNIRQYRLHTQIWLAAELTALIFLTLFGLDSIFPAALALEQQARCGLSEHAHEEACYVGNVLICADKMHAHNETCYLVLLEDNDINWLLSVVDDTEDKSLETVITNVISQAMDLGGAGENSIAIPAASDALSASSLAEPDAPVFHSDEPEPAISRPEPPRSNTSWPNDTAPEISGQNSSAIHSLTLDAGQIRTLNATIAERGIDPSIVLNENISFSLPPADTAPSATNP